MTGAVSIEIFLNFECHLLRGPLVVIFKSVVSYPGHDPYILPGPGAPALSHLKGHNTLAMSS